MDYGIMLIFEFLQSFNRISLHRIFRTCIAALSLCRTFVGAKSKRMHSGPLWRRTWRMLSKRVFPLGQFLCSTVADRMSIGCSRRWRHDRSRDVCIFGRDSVSYPHWGQFES